MRRLARLLGMTSLLCVVCVSTVALTAPEPPPGRQLSAPGAQARVPTDWEVTGEGTVIRYADRAGRVTAEVSAPAVYDSGFCPGAGSSRAFAGFLPARSGETAAVARETAREWAAAVALDPATGERHRVGELSAAAVDDGRRADVVVDVPEGRCHPPRARVTVVAVHGGADGRRGDVVPFVLVRDVDADGVLPTPVAEEIVASVRAG